MAAAKAGRVLKYDESSIKSLTFPDSIRKKPGMYIGPTDGRGIWTILREVLDNATDEALAGRNKSCLVHVSADGVYTVADSGEGIPVKAIEVRDSVHGKSHKISALRAAVSMTHTGGKFDADNQAYLASRGSHGVGQKATNALSDKFEVWTCRDGQWWNIAYAKGKMIHDVVKCQAPKVIGVTAKRGTVVRFKPDLSIFSEKSFSMTMLREWCEMTAYFTPGYSLRAVVETKTKRLDKTFCQAHGVRNLLVHLVTEKYKCNPMGKPFWVTGHPLADVAVGFTDFDGQALRGYTNGLSNADGGLHVDSVYKSIHAALKPFIKRTHDFTLNELKEGIVGVVNAKLSAPQFDSQTKDRLVDTRVGQPLQDELVKLFNEFFKKNRSLAIQILDRCTRLKALKTEFTASKKVLKALNSVKREGFPTKFATAPRCIAMKRETFIVEGDSAGGGGKQARDKHFQEVLPLKGKPINAMRQPMKALESQELLFMLSAIGYNPNAADPYKDLRTGKIILLADGDADGSHIESLLCAALYKFLPELFKRGMVYTVNSPEYIAHHPKTNKLVSGGTKEELLKKVPPGTAIKHIKGWGEIDPPVLRELAFDPNTRSLIQITAVNKADGQEFVKLMSDDPTTRKALLGV